ncbi:MAG TPA: PIG-L family deacetylase [Chloroflexia bacterium]|nr:PIG-L family deacetylase [Chloroflexia bacterium]
MSIEEYPLTLMAVHAHPDDETTSGGASLVKYRAQGVRTVVVTCTDGAEGEMHDPDLDPEWALPRMAEIRRGEMERAARIMNLYAHEWLGYRDSGMAGTPANEHPDSFNKADLKEATGRLIKLVRKYRPQVMFSYNSFGGYGHPDHINAHKIASMAFDYANDLDRYPAEEFGPGWQPIKLYTTAFSRKAWQQVWRMMREAGEAWPFQPPKPAPEEGGDDVPETSEPEKELPPEFGTPDTELTTFIDVADYWQVSYEALITHRTQINPESPFWKMRKRFGDVLVSTDSFILFKSHIPAQRPEYDLFAGIL